MEKLLQIGKEFGLEGEKLLEFVEKQQKLEEERRREEEEKEEKRRQLKEKKEEKRRLLEEQKEEKRRMLEEDRRKEDEERETRRQERELRKLELEADLLTQREAIEAAKREHELELARLAQGRNDTERAEVREDRAKAPKLPSFVDAKARREIIPCLLCKQEIVKCGAQLLYNRERVSSACMGNQRFHLYLYGVPFVLQTDHEPLKYMDSAKYTNARLPMHIEKRMLEKFTFPQQPLLNEVNRGQNRTLFRVYMHATS